MAKCRVFGYSRARQGRRSLFTGHEGCELEPGSATRRETGRVEAFRADACYPTSVSSARDEVKTRRGKVPVTDQHGAICTLHALDAHYFRKRADAHPLSAVSLSVAVPADKRDQAVCL